MKVVLDTIYSAIKRLVTPVTMLAAAALLGKGLEKPDSSSITIKSLMILLALWALGYMVLSIAQAVKVFQDAGLGNMRLSFMSTSFILVYIVLFVAAVKFGVDKIA